MPLDQSQYLHGMAEDENGRPIPKVAASLTGSNAKLFLPITATTIDKLIPLPFNTKQVMVINDGADSLKFAFDGNKSTGLSYAHTDSVFIKTGAWSSGGFGAYTGYDTTSFNIVFKPNKSGLMNMTLNMTYGQGAGIAKIELSTDNGVTWQSPSAIADITRSDGATGTAMDTIDQYDPSSSIAKSLTYNLPYDGTKIYALRFTPSGSKNASASVGPSVFLKGIDANDGSVFTLNTKENLVLEIQVNKINISSPTLTTGRVIAI